MNRIPIYQPSLHGNERDYVLDCLESNWISSRGKYADKFEKSVENYIGNVSATSCSNGTVALHLALLGLDLKPGDEVIVPTFTYIASVNAVKYVGATPVFVDSDPLSWNIDPDLVRKRITNKTKAIMCVHIYGVPCDMNSIIELAREYGIKVVEDCAEAFGSQYNGQHVGINCDVATISFFGNKTITTGEGGMVFSQNKSIIERIAHLKNQAVSSDFEYTHDAVGYNYRMTNIAAAIGLGQMERINDILKIKRLLASNYKKRLEPLGLKFQCIEESSVSSAWLNVVQFPSKNIREIARGFLNKAGVEVRSAFQLISEMPPYENIESFNFPNAKHISQTALCLPSFPDLREQDFNLICGVIEDTIKSD